MFSFRGLCKYPRTRHSTPDVNYWVFNFVFIFFSYLYSHTSTLRSSTALSISRRPTAAKTAAHSKPKVKIQNYHLSSRTGLKKHCFYFVFEVNSNTYSNFRMKVLYRNRNNRHSNIFFFTIQYIVNNASFFQLTFFELILVIFFFNTPVWSFVNKITFFLTKIKLLTSKYLETEFLVL